MTKILEYSKDLLNAHVDKLRGQILSLNSRVRTIEYYLEKNQLTLINSLGELQGLGPAVDASCSAVNILARIIEKIDKETTNE